MSIKNIRLYNFRNIKNSTVNTDQSAIILTGENGQGKTNFLEALHFLCLGSSFRERNDCLLVKHGETEMSVSGQITYNGLDEQSIVKLSPFGKEIKANSKKIIDRKEMIKISPIIPFCYNDIQYINGPPSLKRRFFNQTLALEDISFLDLLRSYEKTLKQRNALLKSGGEQELLEVYTHHLVHFGFEIQKKRKRLLGEFNKIFESLFSKALGGETPLSFVYKPSWKEEASFDELVNYVNRKKETDILFKTTTTGPQRDTALFQWGDEDFCNVASMGQLRLASLILKVAQAQFFIEKTGLKAIFLMDDVFLEMDSRRRESFHRLLPEYEQIFYTFLPDEKLTPYTQGDHLILDVKEGNVTERKSK